MANNENAIVNTTPTTSETPSDLVAKKVAPELSPNPAGFGFTKQVQVDSLPDSGAFDTLYLLRIYDPNGLVSDYYRYKWTCDKAAGADGGRTQPHWERVFNPVNNVKHEEGEHATPVVENVPPTPAPEKIFKGKVLFFEEPIIEGKPLSEWSGAGHEFDGILDVTETQTPSGFDYVLPWNTTGERPTDGNYILRKSGGTTNLGFISVKRTSSGGGSSPIIYGLAGAVGGNLFETDNYSPNGGNIKLNNYFTGTTHFQGVISVTESDGHYVIANNDFKHTGIFLLQDTNGINGYINLNYTTTDSSYSLKFNGSYRGRAFQGHFSNPITDVTSVIKIDICYFSGFDGDFVITYVGSAPTISSDFFSVASVGDQFASGLYRLVDSGYRYQGWIRVVKNDVLTIQFNGEYAGIKFKTPSGGPYHSRSSDININSYRYTEPTGTKLYRHTYSISGHFDIDGHSAQFNTPGTIILISTQSTASTYLLNGIASNTSKYINGTLVITTRYTVTIGSVMSGYPITLTENPKVGDFIIDDVKVLDFSFNYPGATPQIKVYGQDTIDLTTGKVNARVNLVSNASITITDTVTEL